MARPHYVEIYEGLMHITGIPCDRQFIRHRSLEKRYATAATEQIAFGLRRYYELRSERPDPRAFARIPSLDTHLGSRRAQPTDEEMTNISTAHFWLEAAVWLRRAQYHMRDIVFEVVWEAVFPFTRATMLQTFQHYILVCLGQGRIAESWPLPEIDYVDTAVPNLDMICTQWEKSEEDYWDIILFDEFWPERAFAVGGRRLTVGEQMRWKVAMLYQKSLLLP